MLRPENLPTEFAHAQLLGRSWHSAFLFTLFETVLLFFFYHHASYKRKAYISIMSYSRPVFDEQLTYQGTVKPGGGGGIIQMYFLIDLFVAILDV